MLPPIFDVLPELRRALRLYTRCILEAPPGAGKTTQTPLALLRAEAEDGWLQGRGILMLEPRRMAARNAAAYMARLLGEPVGRTVGYEVRLERRPGSRITIVTEGILTRRLQQDPELAGVGCLIFDEFHERNLNGDLGLALALDCQRGLREDLRILVMSATLDTDPLRRLLSLGGCLAPDRPDQPDRAGAECPAVQSAGRVWPVSTRYFSSLRQSVQAGRATTGSATAGAAARAFGGTERLVAEAVRTALAEESGGILVFLPGAREIRLVQALLEELPGQGISLHILHGDLPLTAQEAAIAPPAGGERKVVLATSIAETSLTIEGIGVVIDSGWARFMRFDAQRGMERLVTGRVSLAEAVQRRGRAGRTGPGVCYRLWDQREETGFRASRKPEILETDLASLCLELAVWGVRDASSLSWLDAPPPESLARARDLLSALGALDEAGRATRRGVAMAGLPMHPRLAHMVLEAKELGLGMAGCLLAAITGERDPLRAGAPSVDVRRRMALFAGSPWKDSGGRSGGRRIVEAARQIARRAGVAPENGRSPACLVTDDEVEQSGLLLALAYPDRVAQRRARGSFRMAGGRGAALDMADSLADEAFLAIGALSGDSGDARIFEAAPLALETIERLFAQRLEWRDEVAWSTREEAVVARRLRLCGALVLEEKTLVPPPEALRLAAVCTGIRTLGLNCLPWTPELEGWRRRVSFVRELEPVRPEKSNGQTDGLKAGSRLPDLGDAALLATLENWLGPFLAGITRASQFKNIDLTSALHALLDWDQSRRLDLEAPTHLEAPSGSRIRLEYPACGASAENGDVPSPVMAVKLQELFGLTSTPTVARGRVPVLVHLLSPAGRPLQITKDLQGFWKNSYPAVRAEMRGRYPRHPWPEDPLSAPPTRRAKPRG